MGATVSFIQQPYKYNPVNVPIWIVDYSYSYSNPQFKYVFSIIKNDIVSGATTSLGVYKVPPRPNGYANFDVHKILKSNIDPNWSPSISDIMANCTSLIAATSSSMIKFKYLYGYEEYVGLTFSDTFKWNDGTDDYVGLTFTYSITGGIVDVGDIITIQMSGGSINQGYNGLALGLTALSSTSIGTNIPFGATESSVPGQITILERYLGTSQDSYGVNGTRQYYDNQINNSGYQYGYYDIYDDMSLVLPGCPTTTTSTTTTTTTIIGTTTTTTTTTIPPTTTSTTTTTTTAFEGTCRNYTYYADSADCFVTWLNCDGTPNSHFVPSGTNYPISCAQAGSVVYCTLTGHLVTGPIC